MHPLAAEHFRNGSINCCWEQKFSLWHSLFKLKMEIFFFSIAKLHLTIHLINISFRFRFESQSLWVIPSLAAAGKMGMSKPVCPGPPCANWWTNAQFSLWAACKGTLKLGSAPYFGKPSLVAITVGKKPRLMEKNKDFYESDCVGGKTIKITHSTSLILCYEARGTSTAINKPAV